MFLNVLFSVLLQYLKTVSREVSWTTSEKRNSFCSVVKKS